jgi:RluA family pseudouridine synthase
MKEIFRFRVPNDIKPTRFRTFAQEHFKSFPSKKSIRKAIEQKAFLIDGKPAQTSTIIHPGQLIIFIEIEVKNKKTFHLTLDVLYEDDYIAIVNKPAGIEVSGNHLKTLENALQENLYPSPQNDAYAYPKPVHRLDYATSGLVVVAKTSKARIMMGNLFEERHLKKTYIALAMGKIIGTCTVESTIDNQVAFSKFKSIHTIPSLRSEYLTLVELNPITGRTHQLRKHLASIGHPILGDRKYGKEGEIFFGKGLFLAAIGINFVHPILEEELDISIPYPKKFETQMKKEIERWMKFNPLRRV